MVGGSVRILRVILIVFVAVALIGGATSNLNLLEILSCLPFAGEICGMWNDVVEMDALKSIAQMPRHLGREVFKSIFVSIISFAICRLVGLFMGYSAFDEGVFICRVERAFKYALCEFVSVLGSSLLFKYFFEHGKTGYLFSLAGAFLIADLLITLRGCLGKRGFLVISLVLRRLLWEPVKAILTSLIVFGLIAATSSMQVLPGIMIFLIICVVLDLIGNGIFKSF